MELSKTTSMLDTLMDLKIELSDEWNTFHFFKKKHIPIGFTEAEFEIACKVVSGRMDVLESEMESIQNKIDKILKGDDDE